MILGFPCIPVTVSILENKITVETMIQVDSLNSKVHLK